MASAGIDHMISLTIFMVAILVFIGFFSQTMQTGIAYERHSALSTKASDLLDGILLSPGIPDNWGQSDNKIGGFGLQDPEFNNYRLSSFSPMKLTSSTQSPVYYNGTYYGNLTAGFGGYLHAPYEKSVDYSTASEVMGINGTYGFRLSLTPTITVLIEKISTTGAPLQFSVDVAGTGFLLSNSAISYSFLLINQDGSEYPSYAIVSGTTTTDSSGSIELPAFSAVDGESQAYALIVYSYLNGLKGVGYYVHVPPSLTKTVVPLIDSFQNRSILIAHEDSVGEPPMPPSSSELNYNTSFIILTEDYTLRQVQLDQPTAFGQIVYGSGSGQDNASINVPDNDGILIVTFKDTSSQYGLVLMPWGLGSMAFPVTFGGDPAGQDWVTTDIRQVTVGGISYQAKLELWNIQGYSRVVK